MVSKKIHFNVNSIYFTFPFFRNLCCNEENWQLEFVKKGIKVWTMPTAKMQQHFLFSTANKLLSKDTNAVAPTSSSDIETVKVGLQISTFL